MTRPQSSRRRPGVHITLARAARLHRLVTVLAQGPERREHLLQQLAIGLRTFYRELDLLKRCGVKIKLTQKTYTLRTTAEEAEGSLPFPDPQLSFAEMAELAQYPGPASKRLAKILESVVSQPVGGAKARKSRKAKQGKKGKK
jgi:predicted DNA-binding transcriptional regulator YafY